MESLGSALKIQTASNLKLRYLLMDGPAGASTAHARQQPGRSFKNAQEAIEKLSSMHSWRSSAEPYWQIGPNPTVDLLVLHGESVLLVRRPDDAQDEPGRWALPGGFQLTDAPRNAPWLPGKETASEACLRELHEETGLSLQHLEPRLEVIGVYEGGGRDPRDTPFSWSRTTAFSLRLSPGEVTLSPTAEEDAAKARWWLISELPKPLAFDHATIIGDYREKASR